MFKALILGPFSALYLLLTGCNAAGTGIDTAAVQAALKTACGFELIASEAATDVQNIIGANPYLTSAQAVANFICQNVGNLSAESKRRANMPMAVNVNGIVVHGRFIR